tara:strand:+ start:80 stop:307 length:228 start_codon:yes stop_codon:yes gene_type:complete
VVEALAVLPKAEVALEAVEVRLLTTAEVVDVSQALKHARHVMALEEFHQERPVLQKESHTPCLKSCPRKDLAQKV